MAEFLLGVLAMGTGVFALSGSAKLGHRQAFRDFSAGLRATRLVAGGLLRGTAVGAAFLLATGSPDGYPLAELVLAVATALASALVTGVTITVSRGLRAPCACFGGSSLRPLGVPHVLRNTCLLALLAAGLAASGLPHTRPGPAGSASAVLAGLVAALLISRWDDLIALVAPMPRARAVPPGPAGGTGQVTR